MNNEYIMTDLSNIIFISGNNILGDAEHAVILSLINDFIKIKSLDIIHNIELSEFFATNNLDTTDITNCEFVLRYHNGVCLSESKITPKKKYFLTKKNESDIPDIAFGIVELFIKQSGDDFIRYTKISVINIVDQLSYSDGVIFDENAKKDSDIQTCRSQTDTINAISSTGDLSITNPEQIPKVVSIINDVVHESKRASVYSQINKTIRQTPKNNLQNVVNLAYIVSTLPEIKKKSFVTVNEFSSPIKLANLAYLLISAELIITNDKNKIPNQSTNITDNLYLSTSSPTNLKVTKINETTNCQCSKQSSNSVIVRISKKLT